MQSKYFSPFSLNIYCPLAEIILSGSALKNNLHDGLHCKKIKKKKKSVLFISFTVNKKKHMNKFKKTNKILVNKLGSIKNKKVWCNESGLLRDELLSKSDCFTFR
jgi:hypothetical protein